MKQTQQADAANSFQLPSAFYTDPSVLERELSEFFINHWVSIGVGAQVPESGDVYPVEVAGQPLLITRADDASVHVFNNICRHRGTKLVETPCRQRNGLITCPYHTWSYGLDGALRSAPYWDRTAGSAPDPTTRDRLGLTPVNFVVWFDTIFINISGSAQPFEQFIAPLAEYWAAIDATQLHVSLINTDYRPQANWKLVCENFLDGYHLPWLHSQVGSPEAGANFKAVQYSEDIFGAYVPRGKSERPRSARSLPSFVNLPDELQEAHHFVYVFPNTLIALAPEWFQVISVFPETVSTCTENLALYLVGDAATHPDYTDQRSEYNKQMTLINDQDMAILAKQQAGRNSRGIEQCIFAPYWDELAVIFHARMARAHGLRDWKCSVKP